MKEKLLLLVHEHALYTVLTSFKGNGVGIASSLTAELWDIEKYGNDKSYLHQLEWFLAKNQVLQ